MNYINLNNIKKNKSNPQLNSNQLKCTKTESNRISPLNKEYFIYDKKQITNKQRKKSIPNDKNENNQNINIGELTDQKINEYNRFNNFIIKDKVPINSSLTPNKLNQKNIFYQRLKHNNNNIKEYYSNYTNRKNSFLNKTDDKNIANFQNEQKGVYSNENKLRKKKDSLKKINNGTKMKNPFKINRKNLNIAFKNIEEKKKK